MSARMLVMTLFGLGALLGGAPVEAQISGRVIIEEGPIGVDVVFGSRPSVIVGYGDRHRVERRVPAYRRGRPAPYVRGMSLLELERYMAWIEGEYRYFRKLHPYDAYDLFGWSEYELELYVDWLKEERRFLRKEHKYLTKALRSGRAYIDHPGKGRGPPRGKGRRGRGSPGGDYDFDDDWEDRWEDRWDDDWDDDWDDRDDDWDDDWDDDRGDDRDEDGRRARRRG